MRRKTLAFLHTLWRLLRVWWTESPTTFRIGRRDWHLYPNGTLLPAISGGAADDEDEQTGDPEGKEGDEEKPDDVSGDDEDQEASDEEGDDDDAGETADGIDEDELPDPVKKVLQKERKARREAERRAKKAEREARKKQHRRDDGRDTDHGRETRRDQEDDDREPDEATRKLRRANLISALQEEGFTGKRAKAVARLLDTVEFDKDDEPVDLKDAIEEAEETFGKDAVRRSRRTAPSTDGGSGGDDGARPSLTADELEMAKRLGMTPREYAAYKSTQPEIPDQKEK